MARKLEVEVIGDTRSLEKAFGSATKSSGKFGKGFKAAAIGVGAAMAGLGIAAKIGFGEFIESEQIMAQTKAGLKSTGGAAKVTAKDITSLATSISHMSGIDDEAVQAGENMLLTFTKVRNEAGRGNKIFDQATLAVADFATKMNNGAVPSAEMMSKASIRIGKALNDPIKGVSALTKAGVQFTDKQKEMIKKLVESGNIMGAQKIILKELKTQFGGAAKAAGDTLGGQLSKLRNRFDEFAGAIVGKAVPALEGFFKDIGEAKGFDAKLNVVWTGIQAAGVALTAAIGRAVAAINWAAAWATATGIGAGLAARFKTINWTAVGAAVGTGLAAGVSASATVAQGLASAVARAARTVDWVGLGKAMGPGLAAALVVAFATLTDPSFWTKNWDLALAVGLTVFGGRIIKFGGQLAAKMLGPLRKLGGNMVLAITGGIESFAPRMASALLTGLNKLPGVVGSALAKLTSPVSSAFSRLSGLAQFTVKVLGIQAAIAAVAGFATQAGGKISAFAGWLGAQAGRFGAAAYGIGAAIVSGIVAGIKAGAGAIRDAAVSAAKGALDAAKSFLHISSPSGLMAERVGKPMAQGVAQGISQSQGIVSAALRGVLTQAIRSQNFGAVSSIISSMFAAKQGAVRTGSEKKIAGIERGRELSDLKLGIKEARAAVAASVKALADAPALAAKAIVDAEGEVAKAQAGLGKVQTGKDPEAIAAARESLAAAQAALAQAQADAPAAVAAAVAAAQAQLEADKRAAARAKQDLVLFNLREKAEKERQKLDAKQLAEQIKLGMQLERLGKLFDKQHVTIGQLMLAVQRMLHRLRVPGFQHGGTVPGPLGSPQLIRAHGGETVLPTHRPMLAGGGGNTYVFNNNFPNYVGDRRELASVIREETAKALRRNGGR